MGHRPIVAGIVQHEVHEDRQQASEKRGAVPDLRAI